MTIGAPCVTSSSNLLTGPAARPTSTDSGLSTGWSPCCSSSHLPTGKAGFRENNRLPREAISDEERESAEWARYQRRPSTRSQHCRYQTRRLEIIPDFSWNPQEDKWIAQFTDYFHFFDAHGAPAIRSRNPDERRRAAWAARQRLAHAKGTLPPARSAKLEATRLWTWTTGAAPNAT